MELVTARDRKAGVSYERGRQRAYDGICGAEEF